MKALQAKKERNCVKASHTKKIHELKQSYLAMKGSDTNFLAYNII